MRNASGSGDRGTGSSEGSASARRTSSGDVVPAQGCGAGGDLHFLGSGETVPALLRRTSDGASRCMPAMRGRDTRGRRPYGRGACVLEGDRRTLLLHGMRSTPASQVADEARTETAPWRGTVENGELGLDLWDLPTRERDLWMESPNPGPISFP